MRSIASFFAVLLLLVASAPVDASAARLKLMRHYESSQPDRPVHVEVDRKSDRGGDDPLRIGVMRNGYGMPFRLAVHERKGHALEVMWRIWLQNTAKELEIPEDTILKVIVKEFWIDGYAGMVVDATIEVRGYDAAGKQVWAHEIKDKAGGVMFFSIGEINPIIEKLLVAMRKKLGAALEGA